MSNMEKRRERILHEGDLKKTMEGILTENIKKRSKKGNFRGGVIVEKSNCCGASIILSSGGVHVPICKKCKKPIREIVIR